MKNSNVKFLKDDIVDKKVQFYGFRDFFINRKRIKSEYEKMSDKEKRIYKMYVYSTCFETEYARDLMWEYLNSVEDAHLNIYAEWRIRERKRKAREKKNEVHNKI